MICWRGAVPLAHLFSQKKVHDPDIGYRGEIPMPFPQRDISMTTAELRPFEIGSDDYLAMIEADTAFWAIVPRAQAETARKNGLATAFHKKADDFQVEMKALRFHQQPSAVYVNPTERCNLNCTYCYIPDDLRRSGVQMETGKLIEALEKLLVYFHSSLPKEVTPQVIFHGAEPLLNRDGVFAAIKHFGESFSYGIQTNSTLLTKEDVTFLRDNRVSIGISLDAPQAETANKLRHTWAGRGIFDEVGKAIKLLEGYPAYSVISTVTSENASQQLRMVEFLHERKVPVCMLNAVRCTQPRSRTVKPTDEEAARHYIAALERSHELYKETGRKLVVANFANILLAILAPNARRLMCDISPCGGGRCFFALAPNGDLFPCSEFIGVPEFKGGNVFSDTIPNVLASEGFKKVTGRKVETISECADCDIRHFCGSPCPAEAHEANGGMDQRGTFCEYYKEQARYAFRLISENRANDFLWDNWDEGLDTTFSI